MKTLKIAGLALVGFAVVTVAASASDLWLHVRVTEPGETGDNIDVSVPFSLVETILPLIPDKAVHAHRISVDHGELTTDQLRQIWRELRNQPDATFVTVKSGDGDVRVAKEAGFLVVKAAEVGHHASKVDVRMPLDVVDALLSGQGEELDIRAALQALAGHGAGELATVTDDDSHVRIWVDSSSASR